MQLFLDTFDIVTDLEPRDSFFGGRVGCYKLFRETESDEKLNMWILLLCIRMLIRQRFIQQVIRPLFAKILNIFQTTLA